MLIRYNESMVRLYVYWNQIFYHLRPIWFQSVCVMSLGCVILLKVMPCPLPPTACLWLPMLMFTFFISEETSTSFYPTTINGQSSSIDRRKNRFYSFFIELSVYQCFLGVFWLSPTFFQSLRSSLGSRPLLELLASLFPQ